MRIATALAVFVLAGAALAQNRRPAADLNSVLAEPFLPSGDRTLAGVVLAVTGDAVTIRTRSAGCVTVSVAARTRYLAQGRSAEAADLPSNKTVFIRGGTDLDGNVEAYQVVWGEILEPTR